MFRRRLSLVLAQAGHVVSEGVANAAAHPLSQAAKLDELLRAEKFARKELAGIEELEAEEIAALKLRLGVQAPAARQAV